TQLYTLNIWLSYPSTYTSAITINDPVSRSNSLYTSYYVSAGDMNLTIFADFQPAPSNGGGIPLTWSSFFGCFRQFGNPYTLLIKTLYTIFRLEFTFVG